MGDEKLVRGARGGGKTEAMLTAFKREAGITEESDQRGPGYAKNGMIFVGPDGEKWVVRTEFDTEAEEAEEWASFLRSLTFDYGPATSRHSEARVYIEVRPGDKYEGGSA